MKKKKSFFYPIFFMIILTSVFTLILATLNYTTKDIIELNKENKVRRTILYVFNINPENETPKEIEKTFNEYIEKKELDNKEVFIAKNNEDILGYAFKIEGNALWGSVKGYMAISDDFDKILGVDFVSHSETPGLGGRIDEEWFKEQFRNINIDNPIKNKYIFYKPSQNGNVDSITGATLTSDSVRNIINNDLYDFISNNKGGNIDE